MREEAKKAWADLEPESRHAAKVIIVIFMVIFIFGFMLGALIY